MLMEHRINNEAMRFPRRPIAWITFPLCVGLHNKSTGSLQPF